ncbi:MAG TPA: terminase TerL endonuclease subunit, partial [Pirellulales bacterium]
FEPEEGDDWKSEETWKKANPALGDFRNIEEMRELFREAAHMPARETVFKQLYLNMWVESSARWLSSEAWNMGADPINPEDLRGQPCYAGLDLSTTTDLSALALVFPQSEGRYAVLPFCWCPADNARQRQNRDRAPYETWIRQGHLRATEGTSIDYDRIRADINELGKDFEIRKIAVDRWNATQLITQLTGDGFEVCAFGQGVRDMSAPTKELERLVLAGKLQHGGNPVLTWCASNVHVTIDPAGNYKPDKSKSTDRIDAAVALIMAIGVAMQEPDDGTLLNEILWA